MTETVQPMSAMNYTISPDEKAFTCHLCGLTSHNQNDVANHYCSRCSIFHDDDETLDASTAKQLERDLAEWADRMVYIGEVVPDFWDELNMPARLAEWLTYRGYRKAPKIKFS
jgi:hypothetical protein